MVPHLEKKVTILYSLRRRTFQTFPPITGDALLLKSPETRPGLRNAVGLGLTCGHARPPRDSHAAAGCVPKHPNIEVLHRFTIRPNYDPD